MMNHYFSHFHGLSTKNSILRDDKSAFCWSCAKVNRQNNFLFSSPFYNDNKTRYEIQDHDRPSPQTIVKKHMKTSRRYSQKRYENNTLDSLRCVEYFMFYTQLNYLENDKCKRFWDMSWEFSALAIDSLSFELSFSPLFWFAVVVCRLIAKNSLFLLVQWSSSLKVFTCFLACQTHMWEASWGRWRRRIIWKWNCIYDRIMLGNNV